MDDAKPLASLSPGLLARKGAARPAMRPQFQVLGWTEAEPVADSNGESLDQAHNDLGQDLGWNDMGDDTAPAPEAVPESRSPSAEARVLHLQPPMVVRQREGLAAAMCGAGTGPGTVVRRSALEDGRRAAFTLRVDAERHLRLRMACAVKNRSAQQLVTEALDRVLAEVNGLEDLARRASRSRKPSRHGNH